MRFKTFLIGVIALGAAAAASPQQQQQSSSNQQEETPCEKAAIAIAEHATQFTDRAAKATNPFDRADGAAKSCGVLVRGIKELREMSCPQEIVDLAVNAQKEAQETLDQINKTYDYRFNCFVPDFL